MTLPFFHNKSYNHNHVNYSANKKEVHLNNEALYPTLVSLIQKPNSNNTTTVETTVNDEELEPEDLDENFFYKHITTHFHSLFCDSSIICIPHSRSIEGLVLTKDIIETHCFMPSPYFCGQFMATRQKQKIIALDYPIITTIMGFKEERTVNIMAEESVYLKHKKIRLLSIDRLLEGEPPRYHNHQHAITIPPIRNSRTDIEFLNMFPENLEALYELQIAVQEFTDSYVYIKGYNRATVERIQHMYMKTYRTILQRNKLLQDSCRTPSEHDLFLELVENVVMSFLHKKIWIQSLQSLLSSQDNYLDTVCYSYSHVTLSQYSLRYPISEMQTSCFSEAIEHFKKLDSDIVDPYKSSSSKQILACTPLEKLAVVKATLDLISSAVYSYIEDFGSGNSDTSVTADELIPLLAFVIVQSNVPRLASLIYYMQYYRLARMIEGSVYSFVVTTIKTSCEFLKDDPLSLCTVTPPVIQPLRTRSTSMTTTSSASSTALINTTKPNSAPSPINKERLTLNHRKSQSADLYGLTLNDEDNAQNNKGILRPHIVLPNNNRKEEHRKSLDISNNWLISSSSSSSIDNSSKRNSNSSVTSTNSLGLSRPLISTTFPSISNSTPLPLDVDTESNPRLLGRSLSTSTYKRTTMTPPKVINIKDRISFDHQKRPASICIDTRSLHSTNEKQPQEELLGDFLNALSKIDGNVVGGGSSSSSSKSFRRL